MFKTEDFNLPLESEWKLRVIRDEVDNCTDIKQLQEQLKGSIELQLKFQHILNRILREQIAANLTEFEDMMLKSVTPDNS
tara:strand:- start:2210 stop:2449 length:240 start_codon:yes stop_codon:yes gene_type:complete